MKKVKVIHKCPGAKQIGEYLPNVIYEVEEKEARRLIDVKGFKIVNKRVEEAE